MDAMSAATGGAARTHLGSILYGSAGEGIMQIPI